MIEHKHWKRKSEEGVQGQHIAIVGYSHWGNTNEDSAEFTRWVLKKFIAGDPIGEQFFPPIQNYFGHKGKRDFWNKVHFFNLVPESFEADDKFAHARGELVKRSQDRFMRILRKEKPDKVFVFTRKGWNQCPETEEQKSGGRRVPLKSNPRDTWGTYDVDGHIVRACGFRHPLYARQENVGQSVQEFLKMK